MIGTYDGDVKMKSRQITQVHEIELSSRCNLACVYCPNPTMARPKLDMNWETFLSAMDAVRYFCDKGTQGELALTGVGEALLNPLFAEALVFARYIIGPQRLLTFSTNGILLSDDLIAKIKKANPVVFVSLHRPEVAAPAVERIKRSGLRYGTNLAFADSALNWTGTVDWHVSAPSNVCEYLRSGWAVIRADGTVGTCCWDAESASGRIGHLEDDPPAEWKTAPHKACDGCSLKVPEEV